MVAHNKSKAERFTGKVVPSESGCLEWTGLKNDSGYGIIIIEERRKRAHRIAYEVAYGEIPEGKWVLHRCDNPACVNPDHLFLGDNTANVQDMHRKGRGRGGIGPETAYAILWRWASGEPRRKIAAEYGVSLHVVKDIARRKTWKSLSESHD